MWLWMKYFLVQFKQVEEYNLAFSPLRIQLIKQVKQIKMATIHSNKSVRITFMETFPPQSHDNIVNSKWSVFKIYLRKLVHI